MSEASGAAGTGGDERHVVGIYSDNFRDPFRGSHPLLIVRCSAADARALAYALASVEPAANGNFRRLTLDRWADALPAKRAAARTMAARYAGACASLDAAGVPWRGGDAAADVRRDEVARSAGLGAVLFDLHLAARALAREIGTPTDDGRDEATPAVTLPVTPAKPVVVVSPAAATLEPPLAPAPPSSLRPLPGEPGRYADDADAATFGSTDGPVPAEPRTVEFGQRPPDASDDGEAPAEPAPSASDVLAAAAAAVPLLDALLDAWQAFAVRANEHGRHLTHDETRQVRAANAAMRPALAELLALVDDSEVADYRDDPAATLRDVADGAGLDEDAYRGGRLDTAARELAAIHRDAATRAARERGRRRLDAAAAARPASLAAAVGGLSRDGAAAFVAALADDARERLRTAIAPAAGFTLICDLPDPPGVGEVNMTIDALADLRRAADEWPSTDGRTRFGRMHDVFAATAAVVLATYGVQATTSWEVDALGALRRLAGGAGHDGPGASEWNELAFAAKAELLDLRLRLLVEDRRQRDAADAPALPFPVAATVAGWSEAERAEARALLDAPTPSPANGLAGPPPAMPDPAACDVPTSVDPATPAASRLPPHVIRAGQQLLRAREDSGDPRLTYAKSHAYYLEHLHAAEDEGDLPELVTWERYARDFLRAMGQGSPANEPRGNRTGRSIVRADGSSDWTK